MTRISTAALLIAIGTSLLAGGCAAPQGALPGPAYAPYDEQSNPFCGALGTCEPATNAPYPIHSSGIPG